MLRVVERLFGPAQGSVRDYFSPMDARPRLLHPVEPVVIEGPLRLG